MNPIGLVVLAELAKSDARHRHSDQLAAADAILGAPHLSRWASVRFRATALASRVAAIRQRSAPAVPRALPAAAPERAADLA